MRKPAEVRALEHKPEIVLDNKDREIINILTINSRTPLSQIAKFLKTSTEVVTYRYNNLRKQNIITDVFTVLDPKVLGIHRYAIYLQFHALSQEKMQQIIHDLLQHPPINWVIETGGKWELILMFSTLYEDKYDSLLESIITPLKEYINDSMVTIVKNFVHTSQRYIRDLKRKEVYTKSIRFPYDKELTSKKQEQYQIDEKDVILLKELHEDSRISLTDLGKKLNISYDTVDYRIKKMIGAGIIKGFILRLNYHLLNFQYTSILIKLRTVSQKRKQEFLQFLYADERFYALMDQIGIWDLSLMMFFVNAKDLRDFLMLIKEKFNDVLHAYESVIHFDQYYYTHLCDGVVEELLAKIQETKKPQLTKI
ncbi:Lrp/AsnC family transcriptional regulator [Candidatus Woesearchaeota archaeon]|nr:Lrp/AsnC family transcriptional regulator [Candidatus Woesearchaeota archaeon]